MSTPTFDQVRAALPELDELRPVVDYLMTVSEPDAERRWSGSGRLGTIGSRVVDPSGLAAVAADLAAEETRHLAAVYSAVGRCLEGVAEGESAAAALALLEAAALEEGRDRPDRARAYAKAAYLLARDGEPRTRALALRRWARAARAEGDLDAARTRYAESFGVASAIGDTRGAAEAAVGAGNVLEEQAQWDEATEWYEAALSLVDSIEEPVPERWHALLNLHIVARARGELTRSRTLLERAEVAAAEVDPAAARPFLENAHGQLLMAEGAHASAIERFHRALDATDDTRAAVTIRLNLAEAQLARGRTLDAAEHARRAEQDALRARLVPKLPEVYRLLGRIAAEEGDPNAFVFFERGLEWVAERSLPILEEALTLQAYAEAEVKRGEEETARTLRATASERLKTLGIEHMRRRWSDVFAPEDGSGHEPVRSHEDGR